MEEEEIHENRLAPFLKFNIKKKNHKHKFVIQLPMAQREGFEGGDVDVQIPWEFWNFV